MHWLRLNVSRTSIAQPHIAGRVIYGVELFVAESAYRHLLDAIEKAEKWNRLCVEKMDEAHLQMSMDVDLSAENFRRPEVPEMLFADNVKPEILAAIAAPLVKDATKLTPTDAIRNAHKLLMAAERYIGTLPQKKEGIGGSIVAAFEEAFSAVTFAEIEASNRKDSGQLPLLLTVQTNANHFLDGLDCPRSWTVRGFGCRERTVSPHAACKDRTQVDGLDGRTTGRAGYRTSQRLRKRVEEIFGWMKTVGGLRRTRYRGVERTQAWAYFVAGTYNLLRITNLGLSLQAG
jgi:hypothetical protein